MKGMLKGKELEDSLIFSLRTSYNKFEILLLKLGLKLKPIKIIIHFGG